MEAYRDSARQAAGEGQVDHRAKHRGRRRDDQLIDVAQPHRAFPEQKENDRRNDSQRPVAFPHKNSLTNWGDGVLECWSIGSHPSPQFSIPLPKFNSRLLKKTSEARRAKNRRAEAY